MLQYKSDIQYRYSEFLPEIIRSHRNQNQTLRTRENRKRLCVFTALYNTLSLWKCSLYLWKVSHCPWRSAFLKNLRKMQVWWHIPASPTHWEAEVGGQQSLSPAWQCSEALCQIQNKKSWDVAQCSGPEFSTWEHGRGAGVPTKAEARSARPYSHSVCTRLTNKEPRTQYPRII